MRIAVITTSFPRTPEDPSGHFVRASALELAREGNEVHVIAGGGARGDSTLELDGVSVRWTGGGSLFGWPGAVARAREAPYRLAFAAVFMGRVLSQLEAIQPIDAVVAHWAVPCAFPIALASPACRRSELTAVVHGGDARLLLSAPRLVRHQIVSALLRRGTHFTFAAESLLAALHRGLADDLGAALLRASTVKAPSIDVPEVHSRAASLKASLGLQVHELLAVASGRLVPEKRVGLAIEAIAKTPNARLVIVGDGPERASLEHLAQTTGQSVTFTGTLPRREALAWIAAADVLIHPSAAEGAPTVVREARALGIPVLATEAGDIRAWSRDDAGIRLIAPRAADFAAALSELSH